MKYTKKPVTIEAILLKPGGEFDNWSSATGFENQYNMNPDGSLTIPTLEGDMIARQGDYIIKGVNGEFYPCKADIFEKTYSSAIEDPQDITVLLEKSTYMVPTFRVTDSGMKDGEPATIKFCKGDKNNDSVPRQEGFFTETLIAVSKKYLEENNVGELASREGSMVITHLDQALMWIGKRAADRAKRGVQGTYKK